MKKEIVIVVLFFTILLVLGVLTNAYAAWTPLIQAADFAGIQADVFTTAAGIISIILIVLGIGIIIKVFT